MNRRTVIGSIAMLVAMGAGDTGARVLSPSLQRSTPTAEASCEQLVTLPNLTITSASLKPASNNVPVHCYVQGTIAGRIRFHMQLPLPGNWNGRLLNIGDGGKDGQLDFADHRLASGYAVANSNTGHDNGSEPRASFAGPGVHHLVHLLRAFAARIPSASGRRQPRLVLRRLLASAERFLRQ